MFKISCSPAGTNQEQVTGDENLLTVALEYGDESFVVQVDKETYLELTNGCMYFIICY